MLALLFGVLMFAIAFESWLGGFMVLFGCGLSFVCLCWVGRWFMVTCCVGLLFVCGLLCVDLLVGVVYWLCFGV